MSEETKAARRAYIDRPILDPDLYKTREVEERILEAILEGRRDPVTEKEKWYLTFMGGVSLPESRPWKWAKCLRCEAEWKVRGYPSPFAGDRFLFPTICNPCADYLSAHADFAPPPKDTTPRSAERKPFKDE